MSAVYILRVRQLGEEGDDRFAARIEPEGYGGDGNFETGYGETAVAAAALAVANFVSDDDGDSMVPSIAVNRLSKVEKVLASARETEAGGHGSAHGLYASAGRSLSEILAAGYKLELRTEDR